MRSFDEGTMKIVVNNECKEDTLETLFGPIEDRLHTYVFTKYWSSFEMYNVDDTGFRDKREAQKIVNDYAVTQLPFVLLVNPEGKEYAAIYSEEGPITADRINKKS